MRVSYLICFVLLQAHKFVQAYPRAVNNDEYELLISRSHFDHSQNDLKVAVLARRAEKFKDVEAKQFPPKNDREFGQVEASGPVHGQVSTGEVQSYALGLGEKVKQGWESATSEQKSGPSNTKQNLPMLAAHLTGEGDDKRLTVMSQNRPENKLKPVPGMQDILRTNMEQNIKNKGETTKHTDLKNQQSQANEAAQRASGDFDHAQQSLTDNKNPADYPKLSTDKTAARRKFDAAQKTQVKTENKLKKFEQDNSHRKEGKCAECLTMNKVVDKQGRQALPGSVQVAVGERMNDTGERQHGLQRPCPSCGSIQAQEGIIDGNAPENAEICKRGNTAACAYTPKQKTQSHNAQVVKSAAKETPRNAATLKKSIRRRTLIALARSLGESL